MRVQEGREAKRRRSAGVSMSRARRGRGTTRGSMPRARARATWGWKLLSPKRKGSAPGGEHTSAFEPSSSRAGAMVIEARGAMRGEHGVHVLGPHEGNVGGNRDDPRRPARLERPRAEGHRARLTQVPGLAQGARTVALGQGPGARVARDHENPRQPTPPRRGLRARPSSMAAKSPRRSCASSREERAAASRSRGP